MKRFLTILLATVMVLSTFTVTIMDAAATTPADAEELYLSDIAPKSATALSRPYYDQNEQGEPLLLNGVTYEKGIWTHPMPDREAESVYDISGYDYTMFYAIVGKEQKYVNALPGSFTTFRVYVDGVLADEVVDLVAGDTYFFKVDITGASELKLATGCGSDNITCDGSIWANARLSYDKADSADPSVDPKDPSAEELYLSDIRPVSWKMIDDGATPGYNAFHEDGTPLRLAGVTYEKGLSTHPGYTFDAEFVYDISDYDYTTFTAIVGKTDRYVAALPGSFTSFHVYVDGVLADEVIDLVAGDIYFFEVNVAGASELKLVTGGGSDNITCDGAIWANAKLDNGKVDSTDPSVGTDEDLYLSDILPKRATALDGPFYDKNAQGEPLLLDGVTYKKGFWTHPMPDREVESIYNISRYSYNTFYAIVGKEQKYANALPGSLTTYRVYVDGVLADEAVDLVAGKTHVFRVNIAGASELRLVTGFGSDDYTCDGSVWGDAKLTMSSTDCEEHIWDEGRVIKEPTCTESGQMKYQCTNCIQVKTEDIDPTHAASSWEIGEQPNCTEAGTKVQRCSACGEIVSTTVWDAKGHIPGVWLTVESATCTQAGKKAQACQVCDTILAEEEIPAAGHFFGAWGTLDGKQVRVCECGEQEEKAAWTPLLYSGIAVIVLLAAGVVAFLLIKKKRQGK